MRSGAPSLWKFALGLALAPASVQAGGVTLITHGADSGVLSWVIPMAKEMAAYDGTALNETTCYVLKVSNRNGPATATWEDGIRPNLSASGEVFIKLDWSDIDFLGQADSGEVAAAAVAALMNPDLIPADTGGRPLAELPLHLVGHSRGASLVSEMARLFGEEGIWVDQVTSLDPVPVGGDGAVRAWENVLYMDNYWQVEGGFFVPKGTAIDGAYNRQLTNFSGSSTSEHSLVYVWYHGTADLATPSETGSEPITAAMRSSWWTTAEEQGAKAGYQFTRRGGGDRLSSFQPAGGDAVVEGFNGHWDLGAGLAMNRWELPSNSGAWPNVIRCLRDGTGPVMAGGNIELDVYYSAGATATGNVALTVLLDVDANPWNGNEISIDGGLLPKTGTTGVNAVVQADVGIDLGTVPAGIYRVGARLTDGTKSRVLYAAETVEVLGVEPRIDSATMRLEGGLVTFSVIGPSGLPVVIQASDDLEAWEPVGMMTLGEAPWEFMDPDTALFEQRFYRLAY